MGIGSHRRWFWHGWGQKFCVKLWYSTNVLINNLQIVKRWQNGLGCCYLLWLKGLRCQRPFGVLGHSPRMWPVSTMQDGGLCGGVRCSSQPSSCCQVWRGRLEEMRSSPSLCAAGLGEASGISKEHSWHLSRDQLREEADGVKALVNNSFSFFFLTAASWL